MVGASWIAKSKWAILVAFKSLNSWLPELVLRRLSVAQHGLTANNINRNNGQKKEHVTNFPVLV